jgi:pilus assembly protein Flp/PilA
MSQPVFLASRRKAGNEVAACFQSLISHKGAMRMKAINALKSLCREESGQDLIEYALILALLAVASIAAMGTLAGKISNEFGTVGNQLT